ncbi:hypothetical protein SRABI35_03500 [Stenotrophomonas lactitubi]|nr:hypothetical protein SRABI35_03500 [Stenotrophomonas lactitubi]
MQRMHMATVVDRGLGGRQGLAQHLPAEHVLGADVAALAAEQVVLQPLQREQIDQLGDDGFGRVVQGGGHSDERGPDYTGAGRPISGSAGRWPAAS